MKVSCHQQNLNRGLNILRQVIRDPMGPTYYRAPPQAVLLRTDQKSAELFLSAHGGTTSVTTVIGAVVKDAGSALLPLPILAGWVRTLSYGSMVHLEIMPHHDSSKEQGYRMAQLSCGRAVARLNEVGASLPSDPHLAHGIMDDHEFEGPCIEIDPRTFASLIKGTAFAADQRDKSHSRDGLEIKADNGTIRMAATDGFRLAMSSGELIDDVEAIQVAAPVPIMQVLQRLADQEGSREVAITVSTDHRRALFEVGRTQVVVPVTYAAHVDFADWLPVHYATRLTLNLKDMDRAIAGLSMFAHPDSPLVVHLDITRQNNTDRGLIRFSASSSEWGNSHDVFPCDELVGDDTQISIKWQYLKDMVRLKGIDKIALEITAPERPCVFRTPNSDRYIYMVAPEPPNALR